MNDIGEMKRSVQAKRGITHHHARLVEALSLLTEIRSSEYCEDETPFSCANYFPDADHHLGKAICVIEESLETLLTDGAEITRYHIESEEEQWALWAEKYNGGCDA